MFLVLMDVLLVKPLINVRPVDLDLPIIKPPSFVRKFVVMESGLLSSVMMEIMLMVMDVLLIVPLSMGITVPEDPLP